MSSFIEKMGQIRRLKDGADIQSHLNKAYRIMGNPIVMFNTEYKLLAYTEDAPATDDPIWNDIVENGRFSAKTRLLFENEGFIEEIANAPKSALLRSERVKYDRILGKLFNKNNTVVSSLLIVACNTPFEANDQAVFEAICKLISKEISKSEFYQAYEQAHQQTVIMHLIEGKCDKRLDLAQVGNIYDQLESNLYIAVADATQGGAQAGLERLIDLFMRVEPSYKYAVYSNQIIIIISTGKDALQTSKAFEKLYSLFDTYDIYAGISDRFENLFDLQKHYAQARYALQFVLRACSAQRVFPCDKSAMKRLYQINEIPTGMGIQYFLNRGYDIFGNPLIFHDMELNLLAYTEDVEIHCPIWQELLAYGTSSNETVELFRTEKFIDIMDNTRGGALLVSDKIKYDRISWRIYNNDDIRIGCTSIVDTLQPFSEDELVLFGVFSQKFSKEVKKISFYNNYGQVYSGTIINRLLSGKIDDSTFYSEHVGNLYDNLMETLYLIVIDTSRCGMDRANLTYFRELFHWPGTVNRYALYAEHIIVIISIDSAPLCKKEEFHKVAKLFEQKRIYAGISSCFADIYEMQKHYKEAAEALADGLRGRERDDMQCIFMHHNCSSAQI